MPLIGRDAMLSRTGERQDATRASPANGTPWNIHNPAAGDRA